MNLVVGLEPRIRFIAETAVVARRNISRLGGTLHEIIVSRKGRTRKKDLR